MRLIFQDFRGTAPRFNDEDINDAMSSKSLNLRPAKGILSPWRAPQVVGSTDNASPDLFRYQDLWWFENPDAREYSLVPVANDPYAYCVMTDAEYPKITRNDIAVQSSPYPAITFRLGVPTPSRPIASTSDNPNFELPEDEELPEDDDGLDLFSTSYVITYVDDWGREGAGSEASNVVNIKEYEEQMVLAVGIILPGIPSGSYPMSSSARFRIYRRNESSDGSGVYQYVDEVPATYTYYTDTTISAYLGEAMVTDSWIGPPDDDTSTFPNGPLRNIATVASLFMVGNNDKMICMSEPGTTHAWPAEYYQVHTEKVIRAVPRGTDFVVLTDAHPYVYTGVHPSAVSPVKLSEPVPCVSRRGCCEVGGRVYYVSGRGLFAVEGYNLLNVSGEFFTDEQWESFSPSTMRLAFYRQTLLIQLADGRCFTHDTSNAADGFRELDIDLDASYVSGEDDSLFFSRTGSNQIEKFDTGGDMAYTWKSKVHATLSPVPITVGRVRANSYPLTVKICSRRMNGKVETFSKNITDDNYFYIPCRSQFTAWWVEIEGTTEVRSVELASTPQELGHR